ncbi:MAG: peptidylprolyl isomerase, partial [Cohnella sp.]|nr:peptidylprolyl isomerase [Cohnella sp.]
MIALHADVTDAIRVGHRTLTLKQLLQRLRVDAALADIGRCREDLAVECWADELGLEPGNAELQTAVTEFRRENGLYTAADAGEWLGSRGMSLNDLVALLRPLVLRDALAEHVVSDDEIRRHYLDNAQQYDRAEVSTIVAAEYGAAQELLFRCEEGADFHVLARRYSSDAATVKAGGYVGFVGRSDLEPEAAAAVFNAAAGAIVGPFEHKRHFRLYLVEALQPAELDDALAAVIRERLFHSKLEAYART